MTALDFVKVEADFAVLLLEGWPGPVESAGREPTAPGILVVAFLNMAAQLIHSEVPSTRAFWREKLGHATTGDSHDG